MEDNIKLEKIVELKRIINSAWTQDDLKNRDAYIAIIDLLDKIQFEYNKAMTEKLLSIEQADELLSYVYEDDNCNGCAEELRGIILEEWQSAGLVEVKK